MCVLNIDWANLLMNVFMPILTLAKDIEYNVLPTKKRWRVKLSFSLKHFFVLLKLERNFVSKICKCICPEIRQSPGTLQ